MENKEVKIMNPADSKIPEGPIAEKWTNYKAHQKLVNPANKRRLDIIVVGTGTVFGSVGAAQISEAFEKLGHNIDRKIVFVKGAVKEVGTYTATVKFHKEVAVEVEFDVISEE